VSDDYAVLASVYDALGMADFADNLTPRLIDYAQRGDWTGRRIVDLGCGTGASVRWFANHGYNITGIDLSPAMLRVAQQSITGSGIAFQLLEGDIRALNDLHDIDFVLALDVLNELNSLRDLETVFTSAAKCAAPGKLLVFDLHTIEGLAQREPMTMVGDSDDLNVFLSSRFDYDRQASSGSYVIFHRSGNAWQRYHAARTLRGFPLQVVTALLQRTGFGIMALLNTRLETLDLANIREPRVIIFAQRSGRAEPD
jgi:SAM-dependent methyltransferase